MMRRKSAERKAQDEGYVFTGIYGRNKGEVKEKSNEYRKDGNLVRVITIPDSPLSRGSRGEGYSVYVKKSETTKQKEEEEYKRNKRMRELRECIDSLSFAQKKLEIITNSDKYNEIEVWIEEFADELRELKGEIK